jgi:hypothetical protein
MMRDMVSAPITRIFLCVPALIKWAAVVSP